VAALVAEFGFQYEPFDAGHHCFGHCVTPDTVLDSADVELGTRRLYSGTAVELACGSRRLTITPNHPVLTERGWIAAGEVYQGDYLVSAPFGQRPTWRKPDVERKPTKAAELFDTLWYFGVRQRMPGLGMQFHGDRGNGQIDVVRPDRLLWNNTQAPPLQPATHLPFANPELLRTNDLTSHCLTSQFLRGVPVAPARSVCSRGHSKSFIRRHGGDSQALAFTATAQGDSVLRQPVTDGLPANSQIGTDSPNGFTPEIALDQVTHVRRFAYDGHVYNLQTSSNWYLANGFIVHNCQINHGLTLATGQHISVNDDDDIWTDNARDLMRRGTEVWPDAVLLYQYRSYYGRQVYWHTPGLLLRDHIGGHSVVAPNVQDKLGRFACAYNGDFDYVESTVNNFGGPSKAIWISDLIAIARP